MIYINAGVDLDDIYDDMSRHDKEQMAEWLYEDGFLSNHKNSNIRELVLGPGTTETFDQGVFSNNLLKLLEGYYSLSNEDIETINKIANKI